MAKEEIHEFIGKEVIADFYGVNSKKLNDGDYIREIIEKASIECGMKVVKTFIVPFQPQGIDGIVILAESSLLLHSYPEYGNCFINIFTCGRIADPMKGLTYLVNELEPQEIKIRVVKRGSW